MRARVLGKANLSEWANFRGFVPSGARRPVPQRLERTRRVHARSVPPRVSIPADRARGRRSLRPRTCARARWAPRLTARSSALAGTTGIVGLKPTLGLIAQDGIIPIAHSQDTAGPMGRTVTDVAILLDVMQSAVRRGPGTRCRATIRQFLSAARCAARRSAWTGGYSRADYFAVNRDAQGVHQAASTCMRSLGATLDAVDGCDPSRIGDHEFTVLLTEFKVDSRAVSRRPAPYALAHARGPHCVQQRPLRLKRCATSGRSSSKPPRRPAGLDDPDVTGGEGRLPAADAERTASMRCMRLWLDAIVAPSYSCGSPGGGGWLSQHRGSVRCRGGRSARRDVDVRGLPAGAEAALVRL